MAVASRGDAGSPVVAPTVVAWREGKGRNGRSHGNLRGPLRISAFLSVQLTITGPNSGLLEASALWKVAHDATVLEPSHNTPQANKRPRQRSHIVCGRANACDGKQTAQSTVGLNVAELAVGKRGE